MPSVANGGVGRPRFGVAEGILGDAVDVGVDDARGVVGAFDVAACRSSSSANLESMPRGSLAEAAFADGCRPGEAYHWPRGCHAGRGDLATSASRCG